MQGLAGVNKVQNAVCLQVATLCLQAGQIAGGVEKTAAGFLHNHGRGIAIFVGQFVEENHFGAFGVDGQALSYKVEPVCPDRRCRSSLRQYAVRAGRH